MPKRLSTSRSVRLLAFLVVALVGACGGDDVTGTSSGPTFETLVGTYLGAMVGLSQGVALSADVSFTLSQAGGSLSGSYALSGILTDGTNEAAISGSGSLTGTIASGLHPSVDITLSNQCPNYSPRFSGAFDSANDLLTIAGPLDVLLDCTIILTYPTTILLSR